MDHRILTKFNPGGCILTKTENTPSLWMNGGDKESDAARRSVSADSKMETWVSSMLTLKLL